eukprot:gene10019-18935_t
MSYKELSRVAAQKNSVLALELRADIDPAIPQAATTNTDFLR